MSKRRAESSFLLTVPAVRTGFLPAAAAVFSIAAAVLFWLALQKLPAQPPQKTGSLPNDPSAVRLPPLQDHFLIDRLPEKPSAPLVASIPVAPLDFAAPSSAYFGYRFSWVSLGFLDEDHLLFTFRVPGLIERTPGTQADGEERHIRAVVLALPSGTVQAQSMWTLHDRQRYLWMLGDGRFLLRNQKTLYEGDAALDLKPLLRFPGPVLWLDTDPTQQFLVTDSREPLAQTAQTGEDAGSVPAASTDRDGESLLGPANIVVRILRRDSGQVIMVSRVHSPVRLPINANGFLGAESGPNSQWTVNLNYFNGGTAQLGLVDSQCQPTLDFVSARELLATTCKENGGYAVTAFAIDGLPLWKDSTSGYTVWPIVSTSLNGLRIVRETLAVTRLIGAYWTLDPSAIKAQRVRVFDAADGNMAFEATVDPVLDAGGNVAISPSGRRLALIDGGAIQVYTLPAPPPLPRAVDNSAP